MSTLKTPALVDIIVGEERCTLKYDDGDSFDVSRETYNQKLGTLINGSAIDGKEAIREAFAI